MTRRGPEDWVKVSQCYLSQSWTPGTKMSQCYQCQWLSDHCTSWRIIICLDRITVAQCHQTDLNENFEIEFQGSNFQDEILTFDWSVQYWFLHFVALFSCNHFSANFSPKKSQEDNRFWNRKFMSCTSGFIQDTSDWPHFISNDGPQKCVGGLY